MVIDVRPDDRIEPRDAEAFAATGRACGEVGWVFRRTAGPGAVLAANVRWLAGYRHRRCYRGEIAGVLAGVFAEPKPLMGGAARPATRWRSCRCCITCYGSRCWSPT